MTSSHRIAGANVHTLVAICLLAATANGPLVHTVNFAEPPATQPALVKIPKGPSGLTLYNEKGERVAQCEKKGDTFSNCKVEAGFTFDDVMNAWVHAFEDMQGK
jgi:hypothetical protein